MLLSHAGERIIDVVVRASMDVNKTINDLLFAYSIGGNRLSIQLVIDSTCNIFINKQNLLDNLCIIYEKIAAAGIDVRFECGLPFCFTYGEKLPSRITLKTLCDTSAILVDSSYNLRLCNVHSSILTNIFRDTEIIDHNIINNYINLAKKQMQCTNLKKICRDCPLYDVRCNGKCHIALEKISREDIISNTKLPWLRKKS